MRIVLRIDNRDADANLIEFTTAESTASGRESAGDSRNGPREHYWQWLDGALSERYEGEAEGVWHPTTEPASYRRHIYYSPSS